MDFALRPVEIMPLVEHGIEINLSYAESLGVRFALEGDAPRGKVMVDPDQFLQVLTNLLSNATKFSPRSGTVQVRAIHKDGRVQVTISDQGPGIPEEFRPRIFQKFAQADASDSRQRGGTGLGLSIARALVERMGGRIGFDTETGRGTTFYFELPKCETEGLDEVSMESPSRASSL
jgi:signal transduction histidine kinase